MANLQISIAGIPFSIKCENQELFKRIEDFFTSYISKSKPYFKILIKDLYMEQLDPEARGYPVSIEKKDNSFLAIEHSAGKLTLATIDPNNSECNIVLNDGMHFSRIMAAIRTSFMFFLEQQGGFLLHASSGEIDGQAYTFTGKSDAGKTTALNNLKADSVIAEDTVAITTKEETPIIWSTPFRQDKSAQAQAKAIYFPKKAPLLSVEQVSQQESISELIANTLFASPSVPSLIKPVIKNISRFCASIPAFNIYFEKESDLRKVLC